MSLDNGLHLDEDQIIQALVDEAELAPALREHLSLCPQCRGSKERFEQELSKLSRMAKHFSPSPIRRVSLGGEKPRRPIWWSRKWRPVFGIAVAAVFVMFLVGVPALFRTIPVSTVDIKAKETWEAEQFMAEASMLEENALSPIYQDICGESVSSLDEEFMGFLVPTIENNSLFHSTGKKGVKLC
jgi:hypothetical protein